MSESKANRWIRFLRQHGPIAQNDSMYDEHIRRLSKRAGVRQLYFEHPIEDALLALSGPEVTRARSVILTGTAADGKSNLCGKIWNVLGVGCGAAARMQTYARKTRRCRRGHLHSAAVWRCLIHAINGLDPGEGVFMMSPHAAANIEPRAER